MDMYSDIILGKTSLVVLSQKKKKNSLDTWSEFEGKLPPASQCNFCDDPLKGSHMQVY